MWMCWLGCLLGVVPFLGIIGWPFALLGLLILWNTRVNRGDKIILGLLPVALLLAWYISLLAHH
jgi:hypothetical protein